MRPAHTCAPYIDHTAIVRVRISACCIEFCGFRGSYFISYICARDLKRYAFAYSYDCMSNNGDDDDLHRIMAGPKSDELVAMKDSSPKQHCSAARGACWASYYSLGVVPAPTKDAGSTAELPPRKGRTRELR